MSVAHWDDVPTSRIETGAIRVTRQELGLAAGSKGANVRRQIVDPGARATPVHSHGGDEEIFYVLSGSGLSWQDGITHEIREGDFLVHLAGGPAHTLIAGDEGLDVLAFGPRPTTTATHLPHAQVFWMGRWWVQSPGPPAPFEREPVELESEPGERPATTVALDDVEVDRDEYRDHLVYDRDVGRAMGSDRTGIAHVALPPGKRGWPLHCHSCEEELFVVLSGAGFVTLGEEEHPVRRGSVVARPPASRVGHAFRAADDEELVYLAWGTREPNDIVLYPNTGKIALRGIGVRGYFQINNDYWEGEP